MRKSKQTIMVVDVSKPLLNVLEKKGFGNDSNNSLDITKAGIWDLMDALTKKDNSKFSVEQASAELERRGV